MTKEVAIKIIEIDAEIAWLIDMNESRDIELIKTEIEILKQQKIKIYEDSCN